MEIESLFSSTRWDIIKALSESRLSPIELAAKIRTTPANVSQQLRLLELAGLVKSERLSNSVKGKPRIVYFLVGESSFIILASPNFAEKKMLNLTPYHKYVLKTMFVDNPEIHPSLAEIYFLVREALPMIKLIATESSAVYIVPENQKTGDSLKKTLDVFKKVRITVLDMQEFKKKTTSKVIVLYDPKGLYGEVGKNE